MARTRILDPKIMAKIAKKTGKKKNAISVMVSREAAKQGISSQAALIVLAKRYGIGTSTYQRSLDTAKQGEVRDALPSIFASHIRDSNIVKKTAGKSGTTTSKRALLKAAIEYLIQDNELRDRCGDILLASSKFDRPINQATQVLEDRIRKKSQPNLVGKKLVGEALVNFAFNEDLSKTVLQVNDDPEDQRGFTQIMRGLVPAFRNKTHHHILTARF